jgi:uncharacterized protein
MTRRTKAIPREHLRVGKSKTGLGLFATALISPGEYIEYVGEIIPTKEANAMKGARYLFELNSRWTINGASRENLARYVNHSCVPNCESVQEGNRIFIKALQHIPPDEELCYDYGEEYFDEFIKPVGCKCRGCLENKGQK